MLVQILLITFCLEKKKKRISMTWPTVSLITVWLHYSDWLETLSALHRNVELVPFRVTIKLIAVFVCPTGTPVTRVTATDADDPVYGNSAKLVYSILEGQPYFSVDPNSGMYSGCLHGHECQTNTITDKTNIISMTWKNRHKRLTPLGRPKNGALCAVTHCLPDKAWRRSVWDRNIASLDLMGAINTVCKSFVCF